MGLSSSIPNSIVQPGVATSTTRPTSPYVGQHIYETDSNRTLVYVSTTEGWIEPFRNTGFKNQIMNGDFRINQRAWSSSTASGTYGFDRWQQINSGGTATMSVQTFTPGSGPSSNWEAANYLRVLTSGQSAAGDYSYVTQNIEDVRTLAGSPVTVSFWAKAASGTPKIFSEMVQGFGAGGSSSVIKSFGSVTLSTSWTRYSLTATLNSLSGRTIGTGTSLGLNLWVSAGTTFSSRTNSIGIQNNTFDIWGVQVEEGSVMTPLERRPIQQELAMCQRYYFRHDLTGENNARAVGSGLGTGTTSGQFLFTFPAEMRIIPTIGHAAIGNFQVWNGSTSTTLSTGFTKDNASTRAYNASFTVASGLAAAQAIHITRNVASTPCWYEFSAEF